MTSTVNLDDANEAVFYIPFDGTADEEQDVEPEGLEYDILDGPRIRWDAYRAAWTNCLNRVQTLVHALYKPVVAEIVELIDTAYDSDEMLPALPHPELPAIAVTNPSSDAFFLSSVISQLSDSEEANRAVTHLYPADCSNLTTAMKSIIWGFISTSGTTKSSARSLASYDMAVLEAWYIAQENKPEKLILLLHDFEQIDPSILQDVIHICSLHIPAVPLVLLFSLSSPQSPLSYFHIAYSRATIKLLRIHSVIAPGGSQIFEDIVMKTLVDLWHDSDVVLGPAALEYLAEQATRFNPSVDAILNILQLAHLKHFLSNPLTALALLTPSIDTLKNSVSSAFTGALVARLDHEEFMRDEDSSPTSHYENLSDVVDAIDRARTEFQIHARQMRLGYLLLQLIHDFLLERGYKGLGSHWGTRSSSTATAGGAAAVAPLHTLPLLPTKSSSRPVYLYLQNFINLLQKDPQSQALKDKDIRYMQMLLRKLKPVETRAFLEMLVEYLEGLPEDVSKSLNLGRVVSKLERMRRQADEAYEGGDSNEDETHVEDAANMKGVSENLADWMSSYLEKLTEPLENASLWDVWYTGMTPFPSETFNPSVQSSILAGLLNPRAFAAADVIDSDESDDSLWRLPDTSILLHRYLESGKMINVYDWFESFHMVLGTQRKEEESRKRLKAKPRGRAKDGSPQKRGRNTAKSKSPVKSNGKGKAKQSVADKEQGTDGEEEGNGLVDEDQWKLIVQARFIRALHELDLMGFLKHTRRKPDHILRTVFEVSG
ncbi:hypothetical protein GYMLUDRAFT_242182 [Collybiopsis luxurians FD-317 M1]|uniref:Origin recognition complex subunit 3 n=1 Tax=Collybiopsis luxurians FD-317 M1 TaxID=944289 RepID=A0A0D0CJV5_9AGAR|nr:hypothetical protein GYMLUDRAFT_242182 [Collybiopsis luxurians FD-317 M1]